MTQILSPRSGKPQILSTHLHLYVSVLSLNKRERGLSPVCPLVCVQAG
ncbi:hypothetical protein FKM82_029744 [Ascaphus truei]